MKKMPTIFVRDYSLKHEARAINEVTPGCEWVLAGEGTATQKLDGTCCLIRNGKLYKRYDVKGGKVPPVNFEPAQPEPDPVTRHWPGWVPVGDEPDSWMHRQAYAGLSEYLSNGTYELIGPQLMNNPEHVGSLLFVKHGSIELQNVPRDFDGLRDYFENVETDIEGIVFHHPDGRMAKIKASDFGLKRRPKEAVNG